MSDPTREEIISASKILNGFGRDSEVLRWVVQAYLASLDAPAPIPQEGVSEAHRQIEEAIHRIIVRRNLPNEARYWGEYREDARVAIAPLLEENARLKDDHKVVLDSYADENQRFFDRYEKAEARGRELEADNQHMSKSHEAEKNNLLQSRDAAEARVKELEAREYERLTDHDAIGFQFLELLSQEQARVKELEAALREHTPMGGWRVLEQLQARVKELEAVWDERNKDANVHEEYGKEWCKKFHVAEARVKEFHERLQRHEFSRKRQAARVKELEAWQKPLLERVKELEAELAEWKHYCGQPGASKP